MHLMRIGSFSRLSRVSIKTLRYYDEVDLLKPVHIDQLTGYRYYAAAQLSHLHRIQVYKDIGLSLSQIRALLNDQLTVEQVWALLRLKQLETQQNIRDEQVRLNLIEWHLKQCKRYQATTSEYAVMIKAVPSQRIMSIRAVLPDYQSIDQLFEELEHYLLHHRLEVQAAVTLWHDADYREQDVDGEAGFVIEGRLPDHPHIKENVLPAIETAACIIHNGAWNSLEDAYSVITAWIDEQGYHICGPYREIYHCEENDHLDPEYVTEIQFPIDLARSETKT